MLKSVKKVYMVFSAYNSRSSECFCRESVSRFFGSDGMTSDFLDIQKKVA